MSDDLRTSFLTYYLQSLKERTREEKTGTKFGFDWVIYNLAIAADWTPHRLSFLRCGADETSTTKTEPEFGVDLAFLSPDGRTLQVFVLKDEILNNSHWGRHKFDTDLRCASTPDLSAPELEDVTHVQVILAYNKDEDRTGVEHFDHLVAALGTKVGDTVALSFDRWNLTTIVDKVRHSLISPALLPQKFFSHFSYICSQIADFTHGSDEWVNQLIPNWRRFLDELLSENADERCVRLLPVALIILQEHGKDNPTAETAWIDVIEWGMLSAWNVSKNTTKEVVRHAVAQMWLSFYLTELERYYRTHSDDLAVSSSLDKPLSGSFVDTIASAIVAHWHLGRLGLLGISYAECFPKTTDEDKRARQQALNTVSNWLVGLLKANPSAMRPVIDIHHIELFVTWGTLRQVGRNNSVHNWLQILTDRLFTRRSGQAQIPFIEGNNSIELVFEYVATGEKPDEFCDTSSVYLLCLMELLCCLPPKQRDRLLELVYRRLVLGKDDCGNQMEGCEPIDLMSWIPPTDWGERVLVKPLTDEGECAIIHFGNFGESEPTTGEETAKSINTLVSETRTKREFTYPADLPLSVVVLACLKHGSPVPPELWRRSVFGTPDATTEAPPQSNESKEIT